MFFSAFRIRSPRFGGAGCNSLSVLRSCSARSVRTSWPMSFFPFSFAFSNSFMVFLQRCRLSEADWSQCRLIHSGGIGDLQHQLLGRLLNRRAFKNDNAVNAPAWIESSLTHLVSL